MRRQDHLDTKAATFSVDVNITELIYICFQMTFAAITPALIVGAFAERMKFAAVALFVPLWVTLIYFPMAHMVWYWAGPDAITAAVKAVEPRRMALRRRLRRSLQARRASALTPASSSRRARSTSPAAPWCTSTPASPVSSARS